MTGAKLEVCVDSVAGLRRAVVGGADRIEICSALDMGGLTPSPGLIQAAADIAVPTRAMIRPRTGDFAFKPDEIAQMVIDIKAVNRAGLSGVVLGASTIDGGLDIKTLEFLLDEVGTMASTLHRVIDTLADIPAIIDTVADLGFDTILSSGGALTALAGIDQLVKMISVARFRIEIMPGSGIHSSNAQHILDLTGAGWLHASCSTPVKMPPNLSDMGFCPAQLNQTDIKKIQALAKICHESKP